jgi:hypothetical protein
MENMTKSLPSLAKAVRAVQESGKDFAMSRAQKRAVRLDASAAPMLPSLDAALGREGLAG